MVNANNSPTEPIKDPKERNAWIFGFTPQAEIWNGRLAMLGFVIAVLIEAYSGQGCLALLGIAVDLGPAVSVAPFIEIQVCQGEE